MELKLYTIVTQSYKDIFNDMFLPRVPKSFDKITVDYYMNNDAIPGNVDSNDFKNLSLKKMKLMHHYIKSNFGNVILFCDTDIVFLQDFKDDLLNRIKDYDILFQDNSNDTYNCGFIVFNCSDKVLKFWELIMSNYNENTTKYINEQMAINELIHPTDIKHGYLPKSYYANSTWCNPFNESSLSNAVNLIPTDAVLVHCIATDGGERGKKIIMSKIIEKYK